MCLQSSTETKNDEQLAVWKLRAFQVLGNVMIKLECIVVRYLICLELACGAGMKVPGGWP